MIVVGAAAVAAWGLIEVYAVPIEWWRHSGAVGYFHRELGYDYHGPAGLPENFAFNTTDGLFRRLISTFVSPLATAYMLVVALILVAADRRRSWLGIALGAVCAVGLLWTFSRSSIVALAGGLVVLAIGLRRWWPVAAAVRRRGRRARVRLDLPRRRPADALVRLGSPVPGGAGEGERPATPLERPERHREPRRAVDQEPLGEPEGRHPDGRPPPAGLRARQRRHDRPALRREDRGGRVELHGDRSGDRPRSARCSSSPGASPSSARCSCARGGATAVPALRPSPRRSPRCSRSRSRPTPSACPGSRTVSSGLQAHA